MTQTKIEKRRKQIKRNAEETLNAVEQGKELFRGSSEELINYLKK